MSDNETQAKGKFEPPPWEREAFDALAAKNLNARAAIHRAKDLHAVGLKAEANHVYDSFVVIDCEYVDWLVRHRSLPCICRMFPQPYQIDGSVCRSSFSRILPKRYGMEANSRLLAGQLRFSRSQRSIAWAAFLPAPIARITVAAPVTMSPPAYTPGRFVVPFSSVTM